jgi:hypothetical protein
VFGRDVEEGWRHAGRVLDVRDLPRALLATLPSGKIAPGLREEFRAEFAELSDTTATVATGEFQVLGACLLRGVPCARWRGAFDLAERGKDFRSGPTQRVAGGRVACEIFFRPDLGVILEASLRYRIEREALADKKKSVVEGEEKFQFLRAAPRRGKAFEEEVNAAIARGARHLRAAQKETGEFAAHYAYGTGPTALCLLTLLKSGVPADDERMRKGFEWLLARPLQKTYEVGISLMAVEALFTPPGEEDLLRSGAIQKVARNVPPREKEWMREAAKWLAANMRDEGWWGYPQTEGDLSNTQYAALGLSAASRCGVEVPVAVWESLASFVMGMQEKTGTMMNVELEREEGAGAYATGFGGKRYARGWGYRAASAPTGSMTSAGLACMILAEAAMEKLGGGELANPRTPPKNGRLDGFGWLQGHWSVTGNPGAGEANNLYFLYGLERACILGGVRSMGGRDWYWEGSMEIMLRQQADGSWSELGTAHLHLTCFSLLFLKRATTPLVSGR